MSVPTFINSGTGGDAFGTTASVTKPANIATGDLMVIGLSVYALSLTIASTGWTVIKTEQAGGNDFSQAVLYRIDDGSAGPFSITWGGASLYHYWAIAGYRGASGVLNTSAAAASASSTATLRGPTITTTAENTLIVLMGGDEGNAPTTTAPTGFNAERADLNGVFIADTVQTGTGATGNKDATYSVASWNVGALLAFEPIAPVPVGNPMGAGF